jgi:hypothetical protein
MQATQAGLESISPQQLQAARGGMKTEDFRPSPNIEDRRTGFQIRADSAWMDSLGKPKIEWPNPWSPWPPPQPLPGVRF